MKKLSNVELHFCINCVNRYLCLPESDRLSNIRESFNQRDFVFFKKDSYIFKAGDRADGIYNIYLGNVKVYRIGENGKEIVLNNVTDGDSIGFNSIVDGNYINSAYAIDDVFCCFLKSSEVQKLIQTKEPISEKITAQY
ncbi:MAG: cyclic nucleotide-binding domain-containing protein [Bacteroidetes bacterium]|nr:cyclic nucleotide-binding domain-containing protein [Bacteroidota bacterium]